MSTSGVAQPFARPLQDGGARRYYGKYRGKVLDNLDPLCLGRIIPEVPAVPGMILNWALPCTPYAGENVGFYAIPPIGANVWIEFEAGDPNYPIWCGAFWAPGETPQGEGPPEPGVKILKTEFITMILSDLPDVGGFFLKVLPEAVATPLSMTFNSVGIEINDSPGIIRMVTEEGITLLYPPGAIAMTEEAISTDLPPSTIMVTEEAIEVEAPEISLTADANLSGIAGAAIELEAGADMALNAGMACEISAGAAIVVDAGGAVDLAAGGAVAMEAGGAIGLDAGAAVEIAAVAAVAIAGVTIDLEGVGTLDGMPIAVVPIG